MDYFAANDIAAFSLVTGSPTETTNATFFDSGYTSRAILNNGSPGAGTVLLAGALFIDPTTGSSATLTDGWLHLDFFTGNTGGVFSAAEIANSSGTSVIRFTNSAAGQIRVDYWNGTAWVAGTGVFTAVSTRITVDIHVVCGVSGSIALYVNQTAVSSISGLNAAVTNMAQLKLAGTGNQAFSQILVSDTSTVGAKVASLKPAALGTNTAWSPNTVGNLEKTGYNDATLISDSTLNDKVSYTVTAATMPSGYAISSVWYAARARLNSAAPANIKPIIRVGGTDYSGAYNFGGLDSAAFKPAIAAYAVDPSTLAAWTLAAVNAAQVGYITQT